MPASYVLGLDLGPPGEPTALAVVERPQADPPPAVAEYHLRHLERFPPATPYPAIVAAVAARAAALPAKGSPVVTDQTAVGRAILDQLRRTRPAPRVVPVALTAGQVVQRAEDGSLLVPKKDLVAALMLALQCRRLKVASDLPEVSMFLAELARFRVRRVPLAESDAAAWREGRDDDLVLAVALACWYADRHPPIGPNAFASGGGIDIPPGVFLT